MSTTETVTSISSITDSGVSDMTTEAVASSTWNNESELATVNTVTDGIPIQGSVQNTCNHKLMFDSETPVNLYRTFIVIEIIMTALELAISITAVIKLPRWRRNYRNQMLMQLTVARFVKRVIFLFTFFQQSNIITPSENLDSVLGSFQLYIDFVIVVLVFFLIKHMYDSLITVLVKINRNTLVKVLVWSWCLPVPLCAVWTAVSLFGLLAQWRVYLLICCIFRWPLMFLGTIVYITIVYRVMTDKIRKFARSLTLVTFLLCFMINFYLLSTDIIKILCLESSVILLSYISGFLMNLLILTFYVILISLNFSHNSTHHSNSFPDQSIAI